MLFQSNFNFNGFPAVSQGKNQLVDLFINEFRCRMTRLNVLPMAFILQRLKLGVDLNENWLVTSENIRQLLAQVELKRLLFPPKFRVGSRFAWKLTFSQQKCLTSDWNFYFNFIYFFFFVKLVQLNFGLEAFEANFEWGHHFILEMFTF